MEEFSTDGAAAMGILKNALQSIDLNAKGKTIKHLGKKQKRLSLGLRT